MPGMRVEAPRRALRAMGCIAVMVTRARGQPAIDGAEFFGRRQRPLVHMESGNRIRILEACALRDCERPLSIAPDARSRRKEVSW